MRSQRLIEYMYIRLDLSVRVFVNLCTVHIISLLLALICDIFIY